MKVFCSMKSVRNTEGPSGSIIKLRLKNYKKKKGNGKSIPLLLCLADLNT